MNSTNNMENMSLQRPNPIREKLDNFFDENYPDMDVLIPDGFEEAFVGVAHQFNNTFAVFDRKKCIDILMRDMSWEEAEEYFCFNVEGAYVGESTPAFIQIAKGWNKKEPKNRHNAEQFELPLNYETR